MGYSPETISVALDGFQVGLVFRALQAYKPNLLKVRLRRFANDSEEALRFEWPTRVNFLACQCVCHAQMQNLKYPETE